MKDRKVIGIKLTNQIEIKPVNESDFNGVAGKIMDKVIEDIFEMGHHCGCSEAKPIFEENNKNQVVFNNIRKCLDDAENAMKKVEEGRKITKEEEDAIWYFNLRLAEAIMKDGNMAEKVATIILAEKGLVENLQVKLDNKIKSST